MKEKLIYLLAAVATYDGAQWSVVDAEGGHAVDGFDFEQVTQGDEE